MLPIVSRNWWRVMLRGVAAVLLGVAALVWPGVTLLTLVVLFGSYAIIDGVIAFSVGASRTRPEGRGWFITEGVIGMATGVLTFAWPAATGLVLLWLIAGWALALGVLKITAAVRLRHAIRGAWLLAFSGVLSVLFAALVTARPAAGALTLVIVIAVYALATGLVLIGLGLRMRRVHNAQSRLDVREAVTS
jgi:uncharacterized membrane protein HdeD (DUF308 family)